MQTVFILRLYFAICTLPNFAEGLEKFSLNISETNPEESPSEVSVIHCLELIIFSEGEILTLSLDSDLNTPSNKEREIPTLSLDSDLISFFKLLNGEISVPRQLSGSIISQSVILSESGKAFGSEKFGKREIPTLSLHLDPISFVISGHY